MLQVGTLLKTGGLCNPQEKFATQSDQRKPAIPQIGNWLGRTVLREFRVPGIRGPKKADLLRSNELPGDQR